MSQWPPDRDPVEWLACVFASRIRCGEHPAICKYKMDYPEYASQIEKLFPLVAMLERLRLHEATRQETAAIRLETEEN